jgi:hypothetical protein
VLTAAFAFEKKSAEYLGSEAKPEPFRIQSSKREAPANDDETSWHDSSQRTSRASSADRRRLYSLPTGSAIVRALSAGRRDELRPLCSPSTVFVVGFEPMGGLQSAQVRLDDAARSHAQAAADLLRFDRAASERVRRGLGPAGQHADVASAVESTDAPLVSESGGLRHRRFSCDDVRASLHPFCETLQAASLPAVNLDGHTLATKKKSGAAF